MEFAAGGFDSDDLVSALWCGSALAGDDFLLLPAAEPAGAGVE